MTESLRNALKNTTNAEEGLKLLIEHENELTNEDKTKINIAINGSELSEDELDNVSGGSLMNLFMSKSEINQMKETIKDITKNKASPNSKYAKIADAILKTIM